MPRKCSICSHADTKKINKAICNSDSYRNIGDRFGMSHVTVSRHVDTCLKLDSKAINENVKIKQAINVYEEFTEQLDFAKSLRLAAREYLADTADPLKLSITPKAHEIEVTYFDHNDMETIGFGENAIERPKKKTAQLSVILESLTVGGMEPDKFKVTTIDIRKFALDAIHTTDVCIDKFAKIEGLYTKDKDNPVTIENITTGIKEWYTNIVHDHKEYGKPMPEESELMAEIERACKPNGLNARTVFEKVQELGGVQ